ncbi:MAG: GIY-YIG nuclease family protein [Bdellovibrionota bacterium]
MWFLYIVETELGRFYTGVAKDVNQRFRQHSGEIKGGAKFFRSDKASLLLYVKKCKNRSEAQKLESRIKSLSRKEKEELVYSF